MKRIYFLFVVVITVMQVGCATQGVQQLNSNPKANSAFIKSSSTVLVRYVNNDEVKTGYIGQVQTYQVDPGQHTLLVEYSDLYQIDADQHEKLVSRPAKVTFMAEQGKTYQIKNPPQKDLEQARIFAEHPDFNVVDAKSGVEVEATVELSRPRSFLTTLKSAVSPTYEFASDEVDTHPGANPLPTTLEALQTLWNEASKMDRETFLQWVSEQK